MTSKYESIFFRFVKNASQIECMHHDGLYAL